MVVLSSTCGSYPLPTHVDSEDFEDETERRGLMSASNKAAIHVQQKPLGRRSKTRSSRTRRVEVDVGSDPSVPLTSISFASSSLEDYKYGRENGSRGGDGNTEEGADLEDESVDPIIHPNMSSISMSSTAFYNTEVLMARFQPRQEEGSVSTLIEADEEEEVEQVFSGHSRSRHSCQPSQRSGRSVRSQSRQSPYESPPRPGRPGSGSNRRQQQWDVIAETKQDDENVVRSPSSCHHRRQPPATTTTSTTISSKEESWRIEAEEEQCPGRNRSRRLLSIPMVARHAVVSLKEGEGSVVTLIEPDDHDGMGEEGNFSSPRLHRSIPRESSYDRDLTVIDDDDVGEGGTVPDEEHEGGRDTRLDYTFGEAEMDQPALPRRDTSDVNHQQQGPLEQYLCWRLDPSESLSDWKLKIFNRSTKEFKTYHVHRVVLAVGPRACGFFQDAFQEGGVGSINQGSRVPLIAQACQWVPDFLDYCYGKASFQITNMNAVGLCYLADHFKNFPLWRMVADFIENDLATNRDSIRQYYVDAVYYDQNDFLLLVLAACAHDLPEMVNDYEDVGQDQKPKDERQIDASGYVKLLHELSPVHFAQVLAEIETLSKTELEATAMTKLVARFCYMHRVELPLEVFEHFINRLTVLDSPSALYLLETSLEYDWASPDGKNRGDSRESISSLVFFEKECIGTLSEEWESLLALDQDRITRLMKALTKRQEHSTILVEWFQKTIIRAHNQLSVIRQEKESIENDHTALKEEFGVLTEELEKSSMDLKTLERTFANTKTEMKDQISGWVKKNESAEQERRLEKKQWNQERLAWKMERQKLQFDKAEMERQINLMRDELFRVKNNEKNNSSVPYSTQRSYLPSLLVDDITEDDDSHAHDLAMSDVHSHANSLVQSDVDGYVDDIYRGSQSNGMSPQFKLL